VASAKLNSDRAVAVLLRGDVVERIGVVFVLLEVAFGIVNRDRPEAVHRYVLYRQFVNRLAVIPGRRYGEVGRILLRIAAPSHGRSNEMSYGIDFFFSPEGVLESAGGSTEYE